MSRVSTRAGAVVDESSSSRVSTRAGAVVQESAGGAAAAPFVPRNVFNAPRVGGLSFGLPPNLLTSTLAVIAAAAPFANAPSLSAPCSAALASFSSPGVPKTLTADALAPFANPPIPLHQGRQTQNIDTSHGSPLTLLTPSVPPPPFFNPPQFVPRQLTPIYSSGQLVPNLLTTTLGVSTTISILPPYITVYFWKRTA